MTNHEQELTDCFNAGLLTRKDYVERMNKKSVSQAVFDDEDNLKASKLGHQDAVKELENTPVHMLDVGNPNHPLNDGIFGYETKEFLKKQY